jgi:hypothetical protein
MLPPSELEIALCRRGKCVSIGDHWQAARRHVMARTKRRGASPARASQSPGG